MGFWPLWLPGGGSPDPGVAEPGSTEPATPGIGPDGSNPGNYPEGNDVGEGRPADDGDWGEGGTEQGDENPWAPDDPQQNDPGWTWGDDNQGGRGGGEGGGEGGGGGDWGEWF